MAKFVTIKSVGRAALLATLMSGSAIFAQDVPVVLMPAPAEAAQPAPAPVVQAAPTPSVAPPPIVPTIPTENDIVNPVAAQQAAAEQKQAQVERRPTRVIAPKADAGRVTAPSLVAGPTSESNDIAPSLNEPTPVGANDAVAANPVLTAEPTVTAQPVEAAADDFQAEDLTLFAGIAAALAALGVGGFLVSRRGRNAAPERAMTTRVEPTAQVAASPPPVIREAAVVEKPVRQPPVATRSDLPVTDPLFSREVRPQPITDPLFAPRNDVQIPIIDPLFAKNARFSGRMSEQKPKSVYEPVG